ncbi:alanine/glycine:cation symporter family protein [Pseudomonas borbori]|uniref:Alanine or glycine:cation symporter, AGCS family n=1 Tax=Pseudomonas borbori TaxID=289003 RepID=A0A1I5NQW9_9PSED|nr:alanine/glycine:cation symporter family protein [Pseudomonas borbori]SFP24132.1 alanine or glycine:cation symporter, AGCS family [Pseudomonas borbori]
MLDFLNDLLWGKVLIVTLVAIGVLFTCSSRFVQLRHFAAMFGILRSAFKHQKGQISSFQALTLSVAGRVGAGNIAGVAVAITLGGPGAVFWMWMIGLLGMATSFFECTLAQAFKVRGSNGLYRGGPAFYIERGLKSRWLAVVFSILLLVTFGFGFSALQSYTIATSLNDTLGLPAYACAALIAGLLAAIIFGGLQRIARFAEILVPVMALGYLLMTLYVLGSHVERIPEALLMIFNSAFGLEQAVGGGVGAAILHGIKRGLFSNEAGLGSAPNVAAVADVPHPVNQGIVQAFSVFIDTLVLCSCTAMIVLLSEVYQPGGNLGGIALTQAAMAEHVGEWGRAFVSLALFCFCFTSMVYNYYLGENSLSFMGLDSPVAVASFRLLTLVLILWGALQDLNTVFAFADLTMALLALVNLIALLLLLKVGLRLMRDYERQRAAGIVSPSFDPSMFPDLNIDPQAWPIPQGQTAAPEVSDSARAKPQPS